MAGARVYSGVVCLFALLSAGAAIDCYQCVSKNGEHDACEDPFELDLSTTHLISRDCQYGYFSGTHCFKLKGEREDGSRIVVRDCSDADWGKNCGDIRYLFSDEDEERIKGCLTTCDFDGCNAAPNRPAPSSSLLLFLLLLAGGFLWRGGDGVFHGLAVWATGFLLARRH